MNICLKAKVCNGSNPLDLHSLNFFYYCSKCENNLKISLDSRWRDLVTALEALYPNIT